METGRHSGGNNKQRVNKLSSVKRKRDNPSFFNQQQGSSQQHSASDGNNKNHQRGQRGKGKGKGKAKDHNHQTANPLHFAQVASIPPPSSSTIAHVGPSGIQKRTISVTEPKQRAPGPYASLNKALDTADTLGVTPTIQTVKTLEQRITEEYMDGPWSKSTYYLSDDEGSDIVDMSTAPPDASTKEDWVFEEGSPSFQPVSPSDEPLDWGSDLEDAEEYVQLPFLWPHTYNRTVSPQPLRRPRLPKDGSCSYALSNSVQLGNTTCEHDDLVALCGKCKDRNPSKMGTLWMLDSGASSHFTFDKNDFIEYTPFSRDERIPVKTASDLIYVEGHGAVLLKHKVKNMLVTTRLWPVSHIPQINSRILSMGDFLNQGMTVNGDHQSISLCNKTQPIITVIPLPGVARNLFFLDASIERIEANSINYSFIYKVDYDIMHKRLGHPSKDVISQSRKHLKGFPEDLSIPTETPVCPGCAQGKMPASAHPPS